MKRIWSPFLVILALLGLLILLAGFQYKWLGQISEAERVRLHSRLRDDSVRFADDFNREMQSAYFGFQADAAGFESKNWTEFNKRYALWKSQSKYPDLVTDIYYLKKGLDTATFHYDVNSGSFKEETSTPTVEAVKQRIEAGDLSTVLQKPLALILPLYANRGDGAQIIVRTRTEHTVEMTSDSLSEPAAADKFLVIFLNAELIRDQLFPDLTAKYFTSPDGTDYKLSVADENGESIYRNQDQDLTATDASTKFFDLRPNDFAFFSERIENPDDGSQVKEKRRVIYSETHSTNGKTANEILNVDVIGNEKPTMRVIEKDDPDGGRGIWTLNIQHTAGSLDQFIANTRNRNLAISFGILALLAISTLLIFISSQRARTLARRQIDFVSSVSHEFRTPLAVIYSAGENLTDGVVDSDAQVARYGNLIKGEGKKLSVMVEQILEFAGAGSGRRTYDFRQTSVADVIEDAVGECMPLIEEKEFTLEKEIAPDLPFIRADPNALSHAIQNLLINAVKYSNGSRWLKLSVKNGGGELLITVEDRGIGIARKELKAIFEPFYRVKSVVDEQIHGNGLGLSLVKQIVDAHKGRVRVESEPGRGSKFTIELPV